MRILKQSTSVKIPVGPIVDATDGSTLETAIALASGEASLVKHDAAAVVNIGTNTWSSHLGGGLYNLTLTASDTDTLGLLTVVVHDTAGRPVRQDFMVVTSQVYDALIANTNALRSDMVSISGSTTSADNLEEATKGITSGTVQTGSTTTSIVTNLTETQNDHYNDRVIIFTSGTQSKVAAAITDYDGAAKTLTVSALPAAPANGTSFVIV